MRPEAIISNQPKLAIPSVRDAWQVVRRKAFAQQQGIYNLITQLVTLVTAVVFTRIATHALQPAEYGQWTLFGTIAAFLTVFTLTGNLKSAVRGFVLGFPGTYRSLLRWGSIASLLGSGVAFVLAAIDVFPPVVRILLAVLGVFLIPYSVFAQYTAWFTGYRRFDSLMWVIIAQRLALLVFCYIPLFFLQSVVAFGVTQVVTLSVLNTVVLLYTLRRSQKNERSEQGALRYAVVLTLTDAVVLGADSLEKLILGVTTSLAVLGEYGVAYSLASIGDALLKSLVVPHGIALSHNPIRTHASLVLRNAPLMLLLGACAYTISWVAAPLLIRLMVAPDFQNVLPYYRLISLTFFFTPVLTLYAQGLTVHRYVRVQVFVPILSAIIRVVGYILFVPSFQVVGIIVSLFCGTLTVLGIITLTYLKQARSIASQ